MDGRVPYKDRIDHVRQIGVVFGQRSQLWWDVPVIDSFELLKDIYSISNSTYNNNLEELTELLELKELLRSPARQLSLGQRMRCEIAASLLHSPKILFLDEPTIGLDAVSKIAVREFIKKQIGCSYLRDVELGLTVKGKHFITNMPVSIEVSSTEAYLAMRPHLETIAEAVRSVLELTPPELSADIAESGIRLTGGGALLYGIDEMIERKTGVKTTVAESPLNCVALGTGEALSHMDILSQNGYVFKARDEIGGLDPKTE